MTELPGKTKRGRPKRRYRDAVREGMAVVAENMNKINVDGKFAVAKPKEEEQLTTTSDHQWVTSTCSSAQVDYIYRRTLMGLDKGDRNGEVALLVMRT